MEIYERIRELRKNHLHMTMETFGNKLGVSRDVINNIEHNRLARPDQKEPIYKLICSEFHINEAWLKTGEGPMEGLTERDEYTFAVNEIDARDPKAKQAILDYWKLNEDDKELFWKFIERFSISKSRAD